MLRLSIFWLAITAGAAAARADLPTPELQSLVETVRAECAALDSSVLTVPEDAAQQVDLTGDGRGWLLDYGRMECSNVPSLSCGTGGCRLALVVGDHVTERLTKGWQVVDMPPYRVVLMQVHGTLCGGINPTPCFEALAWDQDAGAFMTLAPRED